MARRIAHAQLLAPNGIYAREAAEAVGYRPSPTSRFCVVRRDEAAPWELVHVRSGAKVDSLLPALSRKLTCADKLVVAAAFDAATHLDWSDFDALPEVTRAQGSKPRLEPTDKMRAMVQTLVTIAGDALEARR